MRQPLTPCDAGRAMSARAKEKHMPVKNRFAELLPEITAWRRDFTSIPNCNMRHRTAGKGRRSCAPLA